MNTENIALTDTRLNAESQALQHKQPGFYTEKETVSDRYQPRDDGEDTKETFDSSEKGNLTLSQASDDTDVSESTLLASIEDIQASVLSSVAKLLKRYCFQATGRTEKSWFLI